jgi:dolichyl-phosphate beta-glucosyltransferase
MLCARGEVLLMVDADGATLFSDIEKLELQLKRSEHDRFGLAIGSRAHLGEDDSVKVRLSTHC